jgi:predicted dehydrogenase
VALAEPNAARAREAADRFRIPRSYSEYRELLEQPDIDAVSIATPNHLHLAVVVDALKARKHVFLEPPMAMNAKEAARMAETADKMRRVLMVGMGHRFHPESQVARHAVHRGDLGEVYHARCFHLRRFGIPRIGSWFTQKKFSGGGCALDLGAPMLDLALFLMGEFQVVHVVAHNHARFGPQGVGEFERGRSDVDPRRPFDVEDYSTALLRLKSGRTVQLETSWAGYHLPDQREHGVDILGTAAGLSLFPARLCRNSLNGYETVHLHLSKLPQPEDPLHHFVNAVLDDRRPLVATEESLRVQQILDAIYTSAQTGKEVRPG